MWRIILQVDRFLGAFPKSRKATISFVMSVRLGVRMKRIASHYTDFYEIQYSRIFRKSVGKDKFSLKSDRNYGYFTWRPIYIFYHISLNSYQNEKYFIQISI
jgi:hypothetical protein